MNIKEIALKICRGMNPYSDLHESEFIYFANKLIESYKAELLKEVGEPVAYMTTDEEGSASMLFFDRSEALKYSGDEEPVNLFTESQLAELEAEIERLKDEQFKRLEREAEKRMKLREQLATAEQRVAEACAKLQFERSVYRHGYDKHKDAEAIRSGEYRKFVKEG